MNKYKVVVWASVGGRMSTKVVSIESENTPTDNEINEEYEKHIGNILNSGAYLFIEEEEE